MIAAIAPTPTGTASCISSPRRRTSRSASANASAPAATRAEYSPRLCPATATGARPAAAAARQVAIEAVRIAGWVLAVSCSSSSGPSQQSRDRAKPEDLVGLLEGRPRRRRAVRPGAAHADALRALTGEDAGGHHRKSPAPQTRPEPKAAHSTTSPSSILPARFSSSSAIGTDAAEVLP